MRKDQQVQYALGLSGPLNDGVIIKVERSAVIVKDNKNNTHYRVRHALVYPR